MSIVVFLQNAWSPFYAGGEWERKSWLRALKVSRSGQRLKLLIDDFDVCENTTPICGKEPSSVVPADLQYIGKILERRAPVKVVTCGKQAEAALLQVWGGTLIALPHPAYRVVTNALFTEARKLVEGDFIERMALRQGRDVIIREYI